MCFLVEPSTRPGLLWTRSEIGALLLSPLQVQTVLKKVPVSSPNQTEPIVQNKKALEYKWGMNVLGECLTPTG